METNKKPVLLNSSEIGYFLTANDTGWENLQLAVHDIFHINKIEDFRPFLKYPIAPHRKTLFDFVFVTNGSVFRKKIFESYTIKPNTFFFLPAHHILVDEQVSEKNGEHFVDLVWWIETIDGIIWEEGGATIKLPSKKNK